MTQQKKTAIIVKNGIQLYSLEKPEQMSKMAVVLRDYVRKSELSVNIAGKDYCMVEGWQFAGGLMGLFPQIKNITNLSSGNEIKWQAEVELINSRTKEIVSRGFAICSNKENKKRMFDEYAVLSMAQTRAIGKAYRNIIGWVMKLAGYEPMPSEEITPVVGKEIKNSEIFVKSCKKIAEEQDLIILKEWSTKIKSAKQYTEQEKAALLNLINEKIKIAKQQ